MATGNAVTALLDRHVASGRADHPAFIDPAGTLTYGALARRTRRMANLLADLGLRREERIAMIMLDTTDFPVAFLGAIRAGVVPVPLNTLLGPEQYRYMLADSRARALVVSAPLWAVLAGKLGDLPSLQHVIVAGGPAPEGTMGFGEALDAMPEDAPTADAHPDEPAFWLYSSGSTGVPKGARHVHASLMATADTFGKHVLGIRPDDVCLSAAKLFFAYGLGNALTFPMSVGATAILNPERPTPAGMFALMERHRPTVYCGVPTLYAAMLADPAIAQSKGSPRLRLCVSAGEALPEHIGLGWKERFGVDIVDGVGSTEMLHIYLSNKPGDIRYGSSGRAVEGYEVRLVDEQGAPVRPGEVGELLVRGASAADGYWNQRTKSRATFEGGWTRSGDKFIEEDDGRYVYQGRADDMFKVSGIWVSPFEVESALISHPAVLEAAVVPATDKDGLLKPKAFVILKTGAAEAGLDAALKAHVKAAIGQWKYPRWIDFVETLPKTATGKIQRFKLRAAEA
jgi:4-hydroxybenzoate-CoA ligase